MVEEKKTEVDEKKLEAEELNTLVEDRQQQHDVQTHDGGNDLKKNQQQHKNDDDDNDDDDDPNDLEKWGKLSDTETLRRYKNIVILLVLTGFTVVNYVVPNVKLVLKYSEAAQNIRYVRMTLAYIIAPIFITTLVNLAWWVLQYAIIILNYH